MDRDWDIIRLLTLAIENPDRASLPTYTEEVLHEQLKLMTEMGFITTESSFSQGSFREADGKELAMFKYSKVHKDSIALFRLTSDGHDFVALARDGGLWAAALSKLSNRPRTKDALLKALRDIEEARHKLHHVAS